MRISFSAEEKIKLLSTIRVWDRSQLTQDVFRKLQAKYGIPAYLVETMFWHMEILRRLLPVSEFLVFKGGTCVQSYTDPMLQRSSNDLDRTLVINKLTLIAERTGRNAVEMLRSSASTVMAFGDRSSEAQGFASMVCKGGKELVKDWELGCEKTAGKILRLVP